MEELYPDNAMEEVSGKDVIGTVAVRRSVVYYDGTEGEADLHPIVEESTGPLTNLPA